MRGRDQGADGELPRSPRGLRLRFLSARSEQAFRQEYARRIRAQSQLALGTGAGAYAVLGVEDPWFFPEQFPAIWAIRLAVLLVIATGLLLTVSALWQRYNQAILAGVALAAGVGPLAILVLANAETANSYYFGLALVIVWTHTFSGLRAGPALAVSATPLVAYAVVMSLYHQPPLQYAITNALNLSVAATIAAIAGYVIERQRRLVFGQTQVLEAEHRNHRDLALRDHLTGLPNRIHFEAAAETARARARRQSCRLAILFLDLDGFKAVNDELGHDAGDQVLATAARALEQCLRSTDTVARMGGDEFLVLLEDLGETDEAAHVAEGLLAALHAPIAVHAGNGTARIVRISASIGVAVSWGEMPLTQQIRLADDAMYAAKERGPGGYRLVAEPVAAPIA